MTIEWLETENKVSGESIEQACGTRVAIKGNGSLPWWRPKESVIVVSVRKKLSGLA